MPGASGATVIGTLAGAAHAIRGVAAVLGPDVVGATGQVCAALEYAPLESVKTRGPGWPARCCRS